MRFPSTKKVIRKTLKVLAWLAGSIIFLFVLLLILIQVPAVQNFAKGKIVSYLEDKLKTKVRIDKLSVDFPKQIVLKGVYFEDQKKDTLLIGEKLQVDIALLKLLQDKVEISYIQLDGINTKIYRTGNDKFFNYQYIIDAFTDTTTNEQTDTTAMQFKVGELVLNNINTSFRDDQTGIDFLMHLGKSKTSFKTFDPAKMNFNIPVISFDGITGHMYQNKPMLEPEPEAKVEAESNEPFNMQLALKGIGFTNIQFDYRNDVSPMKADLDLGELSADVNAIDLSTLDVKLDKIKLHNTKANLTIGNSIQSAIVKKEVKKEIKAQANNPWKILISNIDFANNNIVYDDNTVAPVTTGMDFSHLGIDSLNFKAGNMLLTPSGYSGDISSASFTEKSGFDLRNLQAKFVYTDSGVSFKNLYLVTDKTLLKDEIAITYPSLDSIVKDVGSLYLSANLQQSKLAVKDILVFVPQLQSNLGAFKNNVISLNTRIAGYVRDLSIPQLQFSGIGNTIVNVSGSIKGLPDPNKTSYDLKINSLSTNKNDIVNLLPAGTIPPNINLPNQINASGIFKGTATNFTTDMSVQTDKGNAVITGSVNTAAERYNLKGSLKQVNLGYLVKDTMLGKVTMSFAAKGNGFTPASMYTDTRANIASVYLNGYEYKNLDATVSLKKGYGNLIASMHDPNAVFNVTASGLIKERSAADVKLDMIIDSLNLKPLGFTKEDIKLHGNIIADVPSADINDPVGIININNLWVQSNNDIYKADSITVTARNSDSGKVITLLSQVINAQLYGQYKLATLANGPIQLINRYYDLGVKTSAATNDQWRLDAVIVPDSLLFAFVPSLVGTDTIRATAGFNGTEDSLGLLVNAPKIQSGTQVIDSLTINAHNSGDKFLYGATFNKAGSKSFMIQRTSLSGYAKNNELINDIAIKDADGKDKYEMGFKVAQVNNKIRINLLDTLLLDYNNWSVDRSNYILYDSTGVIVKNFLIENEGQSLQINSQSESKYAPVDIALKNFRIKTLTNFAEQDSLFMDGVINGTAQVKDPLTDPVFTSDLTINDLSYNKDTVGNLTLKVDNLTANTYTANATITGKGNDVKLNGTYVTNGNMNLLLAIDSLSLKTLKAFSFGAITEAKGNLTGRVDIKGTTSNPAANGELNFVNAYITPAATGENLHLSSESIKVKDNDIYFDKFTLLDSAGNKAILDGGIYTRNFTKYSFDLVFSANDFRALNTVKKPNALYYGRLNIDADVYVEGPLEAPTIDADLVINKQTDVTFVLPGQNPEIQNRDGVVEFFDADATENTDSVFKKRADSLLRSKAFAGMDVNATIQSDTSAQITIITDERTGDAIKIRGKANLSGGIDKSGKTSLTGSYQLQSGYYQVSLSVLKKQFAIQPGSYIVWNGDPMSATVDITANYTANTQPINLMQSELGSLPPTTVNRYKARVPFNVVLSMKGELIKPIITFDIQLDESQKNRWADVETKLQYIRGDEGELNKQVFALLLLNRFVQENPLKNSADGSSFATTAKTSVSKILADQINNLAGSLIQGVDINFGINTENDYTSGTAQSRTDLTVGVSKKLLNDRLRVSVGSNFELEGPSNANENANNIAGDIAVDYLLSKDGRYTLRAYRRNRYEGVVEGQVVESGVSFLFTLDFDSLKQLFARLTPKQKQERQEDKKVEKEQRVIEQEKIKKENTNVQ